ncbi:hypothetical protein FRC08_018450 [Ceratobasidium sp. 394]|nr:hypothetical protein FRC08_018450 [Ceratobasidium sp. 394]
MAYYPDRLEKGRGTKERILKEYDEELDSILGIPLEPARLSPVDFGAFVKTMQWKKADRTKTWKELTTSVASTSGKTGRGSASGSSTLDSATPNKKRTLEVTAEGRRDGDVDVGGSASNKGTVPLIMVKYEGRSVVVRRRSDYEATIRSVKEVFPSLRTLDDQNIHLSAVLKEFGEDSVEISQDVWSDLVSQIKVVQVSVDDQKEAGPNDGADGSSRKRSRR